MTEHIIIRILNRIFDLIVLNVLWIIFSLPIVTIGASTTALYTVTLKMVRNEEGYLFREFWNGFRRNFRQSTIVWMILAFIGGFLGADLMILRRHPGVMGSLGMFALGIITLLYIIEVVFVFPLIAKFKNTLLAMMKNAILIPVSRLPLAMICLATTGIYVILTFLNITTVLVASAIWSVIGGALLAYVNSIVLNKLFEPWGSDPTPGNTEKP